MLPRLKRWHLLVQGNIVHRKTLWTMPHRIVDTLYNREKHLGWRPGRRAPSTFFQRGPTSIFLTRHLDPQVTTSFPERSNALILDLPKQTQMTFFVANELAFSHDLGRRKQDTKLYHLLVLGGQNGYHVKFLSTTSGREENKQARSGARHAPTTSVGPQCE